MALMTVIRQSVAHRDPSASSFRSLFDNFFSSQRPLFSLSEKVWNPPADVYETASSLVIKMEIAGVSLNDLDITAQDRYLIIRGRRREPPCLDKENYHLMEIRYGAFERAFPLPGNVRLDEIQAQYSNGFLIVMVPRKQPVSREIPIQNVDQ